jgi:Tfp pilus assembly protein PilF
LAATCVILVLVVRTGARTGFGNEGLTPWDYLKTEAGVIVYYLRLCFWPHPLVIDYFDWPITLSLKDGLVPGVVVVGLLTATAWAFRRQPQLGFLGAWFLLILGPTSSFVPVLGEVAAERRMYLPLAAVVTMVVVGAYALGKRLFKAQQGVVLGCLASGSVVGLFAFLTIQRNQDYKSNFAIWQDTVVKRPQNARAHNNLGTLLAEAGRRPEAIEHFQQALRIKPDYADAHCNLGTALRDGGKIEDAIGQYEQALRINPDYDGAHYNLGVALERAGRLQDAIGHYEQALRIKPDFAEAHYNLGIALVRLGRPQEAMGHWEQTIQLKPDYAEAHYNLGVALERAGRLQDAIGHYEQALRIKPDFTQAQNALARLQARQ